MTYYEQIHRKSVHNAPRIKPPGIPQRAVEGGLLKVSTVHWQGRCWDCDPRQLVFTFSHGNEAYLRVTALGTPRIFWESIGVSNRKDPGWVLGRFPGKPGKPSGPVTWIPIPNGSVPSRAGGILAKTSSKLGWERGPENIINCRSEGRDVIVTHISEDSDRRLIEINHDKWEKSHPERGGLIAELDRIPLTEIEKYELSNDGRILYLYSRILDLYGNPICHEVDISCLKLNLRNLYLNPDDQKFSLKIIVPDERTSVECREREHVTTFYTGFEWTRIKKTRQRYILQFHTFRESRFKEVLDRPLEPGESVAVTKVLASARAVHLNNLNGRDRGFSEVVPLNFDPSWGNPKNYELVRIDPRPDAIYTTKFGDPVGTALAGQHLIDPYVMGSEIMSAVGPKVDQLGFFGIFMLAAMAFPHGIMFTDPRNNPWFVRHFATVSHSIFDAKSDAGKRYYLLSGNPIMSKETVGAAMVTGPNTDSVNPAREGRLFLYRIPGRRPHLIKTALPGAYVNVIEDAWGSYMEMTMFGLKTETTVLPFSAGGGLDNYQTADTVQRGQRWNAGLAVYLTDGATEMRIDLGRGNGLYRALYNLKSGLYSVESIDLITSPRKDVISTLQPASAAKTATADHAFALGRPLPKKYKLNEAREWLNVGTWYWVAFQKLALYLSVPAMILLAMLPIPVSGSIFLLSCLASTLFAWPFWAIQMMKVGVNPKGILSFTPIYLFWGEKAPLTMLKSDLDIERLSVGKFRISDRRLGNRLPTKDKRAAYWVCAVLPTLAGAVLVSAAAAISLALGIAPLWASAAPFLLGYAVSEIASRIAKRILPNPNSRSFIKSLIHWAAGTVPLGMGIAYSILEFSSLAVFAIPLATAVMAGGWALFMGLNMRHAFKKYFKEQREAHVFPAPNPNPNNIQKHQADTWRNARREAIGRESPLFAPEEFTSSNDPDIDPYRLWQALQTGAPHLAQPGNNPIEQLNGLTGGSGKDMLMTDLYHELANIRPRSARIIRKFKIWMRALMTLFARRRLRNLPPADRKANTLEPEQYDRIVELNRLVIEEVFPKHAPRKNI